MFNQQMHEVFINTYLYEIFMWTELSSQKVFIQKTS
jgi:hypothetical protein